MPEVTPAEFAAARQHITDAASTKAGLDASFTALTEEHKKLEAECQEALGCDLASLPQQRQTLEAALTTARNEFHTALGKVPPDAKPSL